MSLIKISILLALSFLLASCASTPGTDAMQSGYEALERRNYYKARREFQTSLYYAKKYEYGQGVVWSLRNIGDTYLAMNNKERALDYYQQALEQNKHFYLGYQDELNRKIAILSEVPSLSLALEFSDRYGHTPNDKLDAAESAQIVAMVKNTGPTTAYDVKLFLKSDDKAIPTDTMLKIGDIAAYDSGTYRVPLKSNVKTSGRPVLLNAYATANYDYTCTPQSLPVKTATYQKPRLRLLSYQIDDRSSGQTIAQNGQVERGERFYFVVKVRNEGRVKAVGVQAQIRVKEKHVQVQKDTIDIGVIETQEIAEGRFFLSVGQEYKRKYFRIAISLSDAAGKLKETGETYKVPVWR